MTAPRLGTIRHRSFVYFLLLVAAWIVGLACSVLVRLALRPLEDSMGDTGFWADFLRGGFVMFPILVALLVLLVGRRLIRHVWNVVPEAGPRLR